MKYVKHLVRGRVWIKPRCSQISTPFVPATYALPSNGICTLNNGKNNAGGCYTSKLISDLVTKYS